MSRPGLILCGTAALLAAQPARADGSKPAAIPEPASMSLLVLGAAGLLLGRGLSRRR